MNYKTLITVKLVLLLSLSLKAQGNSELRSYNKTLPVGKETSLEVFNKYGTIQITQWDKDSASIRVEIKASASEESKLNKLFDGITVNITDSKFLVRAQTDFKQNINMLFESFKGMTSKLISYDSKVEINYFIKVPEYLNLKIENKYGDVYMEDTYGSLIVSVSNGSFKANSIGKESSVTLVFCDATINSVVSGKIDASFSEITLGETEDLSVNSISSRFDIKRGGALRFESRRDKIFLGDISVLKGNSYFTDYNVARLSSILDITARYGSINTDMIDSKFESVTINSGFTDISLGFDQGSSYNLDIRHINAFLVLPDKNTKTEMKTLNEEKKEFMTFGTVGKDPGKTRVKIDANRGNIYLK